VAQRFTLRQFFRVGTRRSRHHWGDRAITPKTRRSAIAEPRVNGNIRAKEVRVVAPDGEQIGVKKLQEALWLADQLDMDLVEVAPNAKPPVARLMDYGKYKYEQSVKEREARKKQSKSTIKELTFKVKIGDHDYQIKRDRAARFLRDGDKVRVRIWFRGREASRPELGRKIMDRLSNELAPFGKVEQDAKQEGRNMTMVFGPVKQAPVVETAPADGLTEEQPGVDGAGPDGPAPDGPSDVGLETRDEGTVESGDTETMDDGAVEVETTAEE